MVADDDDDNADAADATLTASATLNLAKEQSCFKGVVLRTKEWARSENELSESL